MSFTPYYARADYDYASQETTDLSFAAGEYILVTKSVDHSWLEGRSLDADRCGIFPTNFVTEVKWPKNLERFNKVMVAVDSFKAQQSSDLSFRKGDIIVATKPIDQNWYEGGLADPNSGKRLAQTGLFPISFAKELTPLNSAETQKEQTITKRENKPSVSNLQSSSAADSVKWATTLFDFNAEFTTELSFTTGQRIKVLRQVDDGWSEGELMNGRRGLFPSSYVESSATLGNYSNGNVSKSAPATVGQDIRSVLFDFAAPESGDLPASRGDRIRVLRQIDADWLEAIEVTNHRQGLIPVSFVSDAVSGHNAPTDTAQRGDTWGSAGSTAGTSTSYKPYSYGPQQILPPTIPQVATMNNQSSTSNRSSTNQMQSSDFDIFNSPTSEQPPSNFSSGKTKKAAPPRPTVGPRLPPSSSSYTNGGQQQGKVMSSQRLRIANELLSSEKTFLSNMEIYQSVVEQFRSQLDGKTLLAGFTHVTGLSRKLIDVWSNELHKSESNQCFGAVILGLKGDVTSVYQKFWPHSDESAALIEKYEVNPSTRDVLKQVVQKMRAMGSNAMDLMSSASGPIQRILKYPLFLAEMAKCTETDHPDQTLLGEAVDFMTNLAHTINESKRKKDLVHKYRKDSDSGGGGVGDRFSKLNMHTFRKKSTRLSMRLSSSIGLTTLTQDETYLTAEANFRFVEKAVHTFTSEAKLYCDRLQHFTLSHRTLADNWADILKNRPGVDSGTTGRVDDYRRAWTRAAEVLLPEFFGQIRYRVRNPLMELQRLFIGPNKLMAKRNDKLLDYESAAHKAKPTDLSRIQIASEHERISCAEYEALNGQLISELPQLAEQSADLLSVCRRAWLSVQKRLVLQLRELFRPLDSMVVGYTRGSAVQNVESQYQRAMDTLGRMTVLKLGALKHHQSPSASAVSQKQRKSSDDRPKDFNKGKKAAKKKNKKAVKFPERRQSEADRSSLRSKYGPQELYAVTADFHSSSPQGEWSHALDLAAYEGDLVLAVVKKDPMGDDSRWYVDNGVAKGFLPSVILQSMAGNRTGQSKRPSLPTDMMPATKQKSPTPKSTSSTALLDFGDSPTTTTPKTNSRTVDDLLDLEFDLLSGPPVPQRNDNPASRPIAASTAKPDWVTFGSPRQSDEKTPAFAFLPPPPSASAVTRQTNSTKQTLESDLGVQWRLQGGRDAPGQVTSQQPHTAFTSNSTGNPFWSMIADGNPAPMSMPIQPQSQFYIPPRTTSIISTSSSKDPFKDIWMAAKNAPLPRPPPKVTLHQADHSKRPQTINSNTAAPTLPSRPTYSNVGYDMDDMNNSGPSTPDTPRQPVRVAPAPPPIQQQQQQPQTSIARQSIMEEEEEDDSVQFYTVEFDYEANEGGNQLSVSQGQTVAVHEQCDEDGNNEWWLVEDEYGNVGYVPGNYVSPFSG